MAYAIALVVHSWLRWAVLLSGVAVAVATVVGRRSQRSWTDWDRRFGIAFVSLMDTQVLLGLLLYFFLSPVTPHSTSDLRAFMPIAALRFFAVEHVTAMLVALAAAHVGWARAKRGATDEARRRWLLRGAVVAVLMILVGTPWPGLPYGRPLFRTFAP